MPFQEYLPKAQKAMESLGYKLVTAKSSEQMFGNGIAEFERAHCISIKIVVDRDDILLDIKPPKGFSSWRWYDGLGLLKSLEGLGYPIRWDQSNTPESFQRFLLDNIPSLLEVQGYLKFSYFDGISLAAVRAKPTDLPP